MRKKALYFTTANCVTGDKQESTSVTYIKHYGKAFIAADKRNGDVLDSEYVFLTNAGERLSEHTLQWSFAKYAEEAGLKGKVSPMYFGIILLRCQHLTV